MTMAWASSSKRRRTRQVPTRSRHSSRAPLSLAKSPSPLSAKTRHPPTDASGGRLVASCETPQLVCRSILPADIPVHQPISRRRSSFETDSPRRYARHPCPAAVFSLGVVGSSSSGAVASARATGSSRTDARYSSTAGRASSGSSSIRRCKASFLVKGSPVVSRDRSRGVGLTVESYYTSRAVGRMTPALLPHSLERNESRLSPLRDGYHATRDQQADERLDGVAVARQRGDKCRAREQDAHRRQADQDAGGAMARADEDGCAHDREPGQEQPETGGLVEAEQRLRFGVLLFLDRARRAKDLADLGMRLPLLAAASVAAGGPVVARALGDALHQAREAAQRATQVIAGLSSDRLDRKVAHQSISLGVAQDQLPLEPLTDR